MSESYREQHPLLYEDLSEEEQFSPRYQKRRPMVYKGRARNSVKGAAAIIRLWPEHWSSSVTYWWIGLGMIGLITIIVYNSVVVFAMLPPVHYNKETSMHPENTVKPVLDDSKSSSNVYMHLFVDNNQEVDLNNYMPYIDITANKYPDFKYHLIIVFNDTNIETDDFSAEENNEIALNLLWAKNSVHHSQKNNVVIEHIALSKYMNSSPLRRQWKHLPKQFLRFLTRAVSIWDKGGIAFNPTLLTPRSPHAVYIEKIQNVFKHYHHSSKRNIVERKVLKKTYKGNKKRVNNIRDIIDALEHDEEEQDNMPIDSTADAEVYHNARELRNKHKQSHGSAHQVINDTMSSRSINPKFSNLLKNNSLVNTKGTELQETLVMAETKSNNVSLELQRTNDTNSVGILPMFFEFLFRNKPNVDPVNTERDEQKIVTRKRKHVFIDSAKPNKTNLEKIIPEDKEDFDKNIEAGMEKPDDNKQFTIDLKGNIVSSEIPCHAFLGTMFSNAIHHTQESLTDFIITELSIFCKGALSLCKGIDVILL